MKFIKHSKVFFAISIIFVIPGIISLFVNGLKLGIDFTGGSLIEVSGTADRDRVREMIEEKDVEVVSSITSGENSVLVRMKEVNEEKHKEIKDRIAEENLTESRFETVGPSVSADITKKAFLSIAIAILAIVLYVSYSFRKVPKPASSFRFAVSTVIALVHDVIFLLGAFSILGWLFGLEVDSLFVTAALTVIGFSVHDTIVVFDRIRENLRRHEGLSFTEVVDVSLTETMARSLNTSFTVILVLVALLFFGGPTIRPFVLALTIGIVAGTYSSIFNASPILVVWQNFSSRPKH